MTNTITLFFATIPSEKITSLTNFYRNLYSKERNHQSDLHQFIHSLALHTLNINIEKIDECVAQAFMAGIIGTLAVCSYDLKKGDVSPKENNVVLCDSTPICTYETDNGWLLVIADLPNTEKAFYKCLAESIFKSLFDHLKRDRFEDFRELCVAGGNRYIISTSIEEYIRCNFRLDPNVILELSAYPYEGNYSFGKLYSPSFLGEFQQIHHPMNCDIELKHSVYFEHVYIRSIRKLLEISDRNLSLYIKNHSAVGYVSRKPRTDECEITFLGYMSWSFNYKNLLLIYKDGQYRIPSKNKNSTIELRNALSEIKGYDTSKAILVQEIISGAMLQEHGTVVLVTDYVTASSESDRLCNLNRGIGLKSNDFLKEDSTLIQKITSIDGAILIDIDGRCHAIGIILDGDAVVKGKSSRGARYNSTVNYVCRRKIDGQTFIALIISEDKTVDIVMPDGNVTSI